MLQHADNRFLSAYQLGTKSAIAAVNLTQLLSSGIQDQQQNRQLAQSPLNSEGSTSATPPHIECTTTSEIGVQSSVWSEFLNGASPNSFMADNIDNVIPTSSSSTWWTSREQELQWNQSQQQQHQPVMSDLEGEWSPGQLGCLPAAPEVNEQLSNMTLEQNDYSSINTALVDPEISSNPSAWGSILMGGTGNDEHNSVVEGVEGLQEALFSKPSFMSDMKKPSDMQWDFNPLKGSAAAFELEHDMKHSQQFPLGGSSSHDTSDNWMNTRIGSGFSVDAFGNAQFNPCKIKQEMDNQFFSVNSNLRSEVFPTSNMNTMMNEIPSRWGAHSSRLPAMLSQVLPSTSTSSKPVNLFGNTGHMGVMSRPFGNYTPKSEPYKVQMEQSSMSQHSSITSQHSYDSKDSHTASKHMMEESREVSSDRKRGNDQASESFFKRPRVEQQQTPTLPFKVRKEKLGERITALQQLVAPFGKTDTASVLLEAIGYIKFLHEQVQVLSTPYMKNPATTPARPNEGVKGSSWSSEASKSKDSDEPRQDLRSRGLCLVPISCTQQVANDNGADYWTPNIGGSAK